MLPKKLKKLGKECRKAGGPVLETLATYIDHVVTCLKLGKRADGVADSYAQAVAQLDLSAVVKAYEAVAAARPAEKRVAAEAASSETKGGKKKDKKGKKAKQPPPVHPADPDAAEAHPSQEIEAAGDGGGKKSAKKGEKRAKKDK